MIPMEVCDGRLQGLGGDENCFQPVLDQLRMLYIGIVRVHECAINVSQLMVHDSLVGAFAVDGLLVVLLWITCLLLDKIRRVVVVIPH